MPHVVACATADPDPPATTQDQELLAILLSMNIGIAAVEERNPAIRDRHIASTPADNPIFQVPAPRLVRPGTEVQLIISAPDEGPGSIESARWEIVSCRTLDGLELFERIAYWMSPVGGSTDPTFRVRFRHSGQCTIRLFVEGEGPPYRFRNEHTDMVVQTIY